MYTMSISATIRKTQIWKKKHTHKTHAYTVISLTVFVQSVVLVECVCVVVKNKHQ